MKMNGDNGKRLRKVSGIILALLFIALISSCSPVSDTLTLCRVSLDNPSSRSLTATVDPLGNNVYVKTKYKGTGERYTNLSESEYCKIPTEGIVVSQGLWEVQAIFSSDGKKVHIQKRKLKLFQEELQVISSSISPLNPFLLSLS